MLRTFFLLGLFMFALTAFTNANLALQAEEAKTKTCCATCVADCGCCDGTACTCENCECPDGKCTVEAKSCCDSCDATCGCCDGSECTCEKCECKGGKCSVETKVAVTATDCCENCDDGCNCCSGTECTCKDCSCKDGKCKGGSCEAKAPAADKAEKKSCCGGCSK